MTADPHKLEQVALPVFGSEADALRAELEALRAAHKVALDGLANGRADARKVRAKLKALRVAREVKPAKPGTCEPAQGAIDWRARADALAQRCHEEFNQSEAYRQRARAWKRTARAFWRILTALRRLDVLTTPQRVAAIEQFGRYKALGVQGVPALIAATEASAVERYRKSARGWKRVAGALASRHRSLVMAARCECPECARVQCRLFRPSPVQCDALISPSEVSNPVTTAVTQLDGLSVNVRSPVLGKPRRRRRGSLNVDAVPCGQAMGGREASEGDPTC